MRQPIPLATGFQLVKNTVDDFAEVGGFDASVFWQNQKRLEQTPLLIAQVGFVWFTGDR